MKEEIHALDQNHTWCFVPRPDCTNIIGSIWVYRIKHIDSGSIGHFKFRLVVKEFTQVPSEDCSETFSPVIKLTTIQLIIALALSQKWILRQLDVKNAFIHGYVK